MPCLSRVCFDLIHSSKAKASCDSLRMGAPKSFYNSRFLIEAVFPSARTMGRRLGADAPQRKRKVEDAAWVESDSES